MCYLCCLFSYIKSFHLLDKFVFVVFSHFAVCFQNHAAYLVSVFDFLPLFTLLILLFLFILRCFVLITSFILLFWCCNNIASVYLSAVIYLVISFFVISI